MKSVEALRVIELMNMTSVYMGTDAETRGKEIRWKQHEIARPRELDAYHELDVYEKAGVPFSTVQLRFGSDELPSDGKAYQLITKHISDAVCEGLECGDAVLVVGGTCVCAPGVAGGVRRAFGKDAKIGMIWLDAHGDIQTPATTTSGMVGGMPYAVTLGQCMPEWSEVCGLTPPIDDRLAILADARNLDPEEIDNLKSMNLTVVPTDAYTDGSKWQGLVQTLAEKIDVLHFHIDADIVDKSFVPDHPTAEPNGPSLEQVLQSIGTVMATNVVSIVSLASVYFDLETLGGKRAAGPERSIQSGVEMVSTILQNWKAKA